MRLALFDLDHTLIPLDSDYAWGEFTVSLGWRDAQGFSEANAGFYADYKAGTLDIHRYVHFATGAVREHGQAASQQAHERFMQQVIAPVMGDPARALLQRHQVAGDTVVIVTATNEFVTRPIAEAFGVDELIAIELERDGHGEPTGAIRGTPSFREGKIHCVGEWLATRGERLEDFESWFYSDSLNDLPLLELVTHPVAVDPDPTLRATAQARGWDIISLRD